MLMHICCGLFQYMHVSVCICVLLVWIITEVISHNPKSAHICICSLDRRQGK